MSKRSCGDNTASSRLKSWVDPSFTEFPKDNRSQISSGKASKKSKADLRTTRKRAGEAECLDHQTSYPQKESAQRNLDESWVDMYSPQSKAELAVHRKKIEMVENWMRPCKNSSQGGILLLSGPSGCGKTTTVRVLSRELGLQILEWTNPTSSEPYSSNQHGFYSMLSNSQIVQFRDFFLRANKYNCLKMAGDGASVQKLILVKDFPNQFYRQPSNLHDILRCFVKTSRSPVVFIVSDSLSGDSCLRSLFPKDIQEELDITHISFNPVAPTTMMKVLTRISTLESKRSCGTNISDQTVLESLCLGSTGDIRSAVNSLQFLLLPEKRLWNMKKERPFTSLAKKNKRNQVKKSKQTNPQAEDSTSGKDGSLFLFRALGKILHCKRGNYEGSQGNQFSVGHFLPTHLSHHDREALLVDPELTVQRSKMSGEFFNLYLHQNFLNFFFEVEDVARASKYLSDADLLTAEWTTRTSMDDYGSSVATRGLLHSNSRQVSVGFRPLHKPNWLLVNKNYNENCMEAQSFFKSFCLTPVSLQTELLPFLAKLTNPMRNQAQITFIQDVGRMSLMRFSCRLQLEALKENELVKIETDTEEEEEENKKDRQGRAKEDLLASQPLPTSNQLLSEEDNLIIDVYISD